MALYPIAAQEAPTSRSGSDIKRSGSSTLSPRAELRSSARVRTRTCTRRIESSARPAVGHDAAIVRPAARTEESPLKQATKAEGSILRQTRSNLDSAPEGSATPPKRPAFKLPKATEYARDHMARILVLVARGGGRVDCTSFEALAEQLAAANLIQKAHPANLRHWVDELKACKIIREDSPGWIVFPPPEDQPTQRRPFARPASGLRLSALCGTGELIAAGWQGLETLLEGGRA